MWRIKSLLTVLLCVFFLSNAVGFETENGRDVAFTGTHNVKWYGAIGDGTTDDTVAFQAAFDSGAERIVVPEGTYVLSETTIDHDVHISGGTGSILKHKDDSAGTTYSASGNRMIRITSHDVTVVFEGLTFDGDYLNQPGTANGVNATLTTNPNSAIGSGTITYGTLIAIDNPVADDSYDRLIIKVDKCTFKSVQYSAILLSAEEDGTAYVELSVTNSNFHDHAPNIIAYDAWGGGLGYADSANGFAGNYIAVTGYANLTVDNCEFRGYRDPTASPTSPHDYNVYNLAPPAIIVTGWTAPVTREWTTVAITNNRFYGCGRGWIAGNDLGVIDAYIRAENVRIYGNEFKYNWGSAIRGKTNARNVAISLNTITENDGGGIDFERETYLIQDGRYVVSNNIVELSESATDGTPILLHGYSVDSPYFISDLIVQGNIAKNGTGSDGALIYVDDANGVKIVDNILDTTDSTLGGIYATVIRGEVDISRNIIRNCSAGPGITVYGVDSTDINLKIIDNQILTINSYGILATVSGAAVLQGTFDFSDNMFDTIGDIAIYVTKAKGTGRLNHNTILDGSSVGISFNYNAQAAGNNLSIIGNDINTVVNYAIYSNNAQQVTNIGNKIDNVSGSDRGIYHQNVVSAVSYIGNQIVNSVTTPIYGAGATDIISHNAGYVTKNAGASSITSGNTSVVVAHGLAVTPTAQDIQIIGKEDPTNDVGTIWVDTIGATNFTVNVENDPGASNWDFGWEVDTEY